MAKSNAARVAAYRARRREMGGTDATRANRRAEKAAYKRRKQLNRPFVGCDGEGAGVDEHGRQNYLLFRMGERELYTGSRLRTDELLGFICDHPSREILVGFAFGYDATMILRDLPDEQKARLFAPKQFGIGHSPFVWFGEFDIDYLPKQYLKVRRVRQVLDPVTGRWKREGIKNSTRVIYETFGFFQKGFLKVCQEFKVGTEAERELIAESKGRRGSDEWVIDQTEREYCALECRMLAELMEQLRANCHAAGMYPKTWSGAGKLAKALLAKHGCPTAKQFEEWVPQEVRDFASMAYYGGRFEITRTGMIEGEVYEYDICSAYPAAMRDLPSLEGALFRRLEGSDFKRSANLFVAAITFRFDPIDGGSGQLGGLPVRSKEGHLYFPLRGGGVYWSTEIRSAERRGAKITYKAGWEIIPVSDHKPFEWVEPLFEYRKSIGKSGPGYPIKLGLNSLYGAQAQRIGSGLYANMVYAGLITAYTRAKLNDAISLHPNSIVMLATDGVYSTKPLPLPLGDKLGDWELQVMDGLFIVQPGLYWSPSKRKRKSRGLSGRFFEEAGRTEAFEKGWRDYLAAKASGLDPEFPTVSVPVPGFVGIKLAQSRGKPETAGMWIEDQRTISFDYRNKRSGERIEGGAIVTGARHGFNGLASLPHRDFLKGGGAEPWEAARAMLEEQPEYVDLSPPWKD